MRVLERIKVVYRKLNLKQTPSRTTMQALLICYAAGRNLNVAYPAPPLQCGRAMHLLFAYAFFARASAKRVRYNRHGGRETGMEIEYFREFLALSKGTSISQTAKLLHTSQSALSRHIQALETDFSVRLVEHGGKEIRLTPEGEVIAELAEDIVGRYDNVKQAFAHHPNTKREIVIGGHVDGPEDLASFLRATSALCEKHPDVTVRIMPLDSTSIADFRDKLISRDVDIMFLFGDTEGYFDSDEQFVTKVAARRPWRAIVSKDHPFAERDALSLEDLSGETILHFVGERHSSSWKILRKHLLEKGVAFKERIVRCLSLYDYFNEPLGDSVLLFPLPPHAITRIINDDSRVVDFTKESEFYLDLTAIRLKENDFPPVDAYIKLASQELGQDI